jgi:serine/threonine-protein phosphatase 2A regulatory subunit B''
MENKTKKEEKSGASNNNNPNGSEQPQRKGWMDLLKNYIKNGKKPTKFQQEEQTTKLFLEILDEDKKKKDPGNVNIPRFFYKKPTNFTDINITVKNEAKQKFLILKSYDLPTKKDLQELWACLKENISPPKDTTERINYKDFKIVAEKNPIFSEYFKPSVFLQFDKDKYGRIELLSFFHYVFRKNTCEENKINLSISDFCCEGFLVDKDLENYIKKVIINFPFYSEINEEIKEYYLLVAQRKFFFFLDPKRTGKIYINDIVTSNILTEFLELERITSKKEMEYNWFSLINFFKIYRKYVELDKDKNGMLSKKELIKYSPGLTSIFIDRIFEEYQRYDNAIDFKQFIDFVLAMENRKDPASIQYIWRALDVYHNNKIDTFIINMFYRGVIKKLVNRDKGEYRIDDIKDEIWDMIGPKNANYITLQDVLKSSYSDIVLSLLIDAKAFYQHDQKEMPYIEEFVEIENEDYN